MVLQGFLQPRSATGQSSLIPAPPWFYSGDVLTIEYRTDPARPRRTAARTQQPATEDSAAVAFIWADWQSCSQDKEHSST